MLLCPSADVVPWLRRATGTGFALLGLLLGLAADARAATVQLGSSGGEEDRLSTLRFADATGERNDVVVGITRTAVEVTDRAIAPVAGPGCSKPGDPATAVCPLAEGHPPLVLDIQGGGGDDTLTLPQPAEPELFDIVLGFLSGGDGNDTITSPAHNTVGLFAVAFLNGDAGDDRLVGGPAENYLSGGAGKDTLVGGGADDTLDGDGAGRTAAQLARAFADKPFKAAPPAEPADDILDGGPGEDTASYAGRTQPLRVDLADPAPDGSAGEADRFSRIENVSGGDGANVLLGDGGPNRLAGSATAADVLDGRGGDDALFGVGTGDTLRGGPGDDYLQHPGPGSACGSGRDTLRNPRSVTEALRPQRFDACELALSRGGRVSLKLTPVRLKSGVFTIHVTTASSSPAAQDPVRFFIVTGSGRIVATRSVRVRGPRDRVRPLTLRLRGRPPSGSTVRVVMREQDIPGRSLNVALPLRR